MLLGTVKGVRRWHSQRHNRQRFESDSGYSHNLSWGHWLQFYWMWLMVEAELMYLETSSFRFRPIEPIEKP